MMDSHRQSLSHPEFHIGYRPIPVDHPEIIGPTIVSPELAHGLGGIAMAMEAKERAALPTRMFMNLVDSVVQRVRSYHRAPEPNRFTPTNPSEYVPRGLADQISAVIDKD
jgi:hypothetical protein